MLGDQLKKLRKQKGITQKELADYLHISKSSVGMWEHGQRDPDTAMLLKIADFYGVTVDYLLGRETLSGTQEAVLQETIRTLEELMERLKMTFNQE
ncbi:MAG: helix-turn-helix transcriptional regulator [Oscillospiraceae bacterium]|nr:helix-turn-helix transcriptional regulator [Oscillospiraceae bacterium]